jgi:hypothetical protein
MTAPEIREWIISRFKSQMPRSTPSGVITQADCDLLHQWWIRQIESRITPELCEKLAAKIDDPDGYMELYTQEIDRVIAEIDAEFQENKAGAEADQAGYVDMEKLRLWLSHPVTDPWKPPQ